MGNQNANKMTYEKRMNRQIREWEEKIARIESAAQKRDAKKNAAIREELNSLQKRVKETRAELKQLATGDKEWPAGARQVSGTYRSMKSNAERAAHRVKPK